MQESFNPFAKKPNETKSKSGLGSKIKALSALLAVGLSAFSTNAEGAEMPEKSSPAQTKDKTEQVSQQAKQKESQKTITWEQAQKIQAEISSLKTEQQQAEEAEKTLEKTVESLHLWLDKFIQNLPRQAQYADMYTRIENYLVTASKDYDLTKDSDRKKFVQDMVINKEEKDPALEKELTIFGQDLDGANFGFDDIPIRELRREKEEQFLLKKVQEIIADKIGEVKGNEIALKTEELKNADTQQNMASIK
jgi:hypothetical protein